VTDYQLTVVEPPGYPHIGALAELVNLVAHGLHDLTGNQPPINVNVATQGRDVIMFGAHLLEPARWAEARKGLAPGEKIIVYNTEQVDPAVPWMSAGYFQILGDPKVVVWDYSTHNVAVLRSLGIEARHVPIGYHRAMTRIKSLMSRDVDIDVLFYGSMNERRQKVITQMGEAGLAVDAVFGVYGAERDALIARSKVVLNMHYYEANIFEEVRVSYLLSNRCFVLAEVNDLDDLPDPELAQGLFCSMYDNLAESALKCIHMDGQDRFRTACAGWAWIMERPEVEVLREALR
jgi:hypothetical protein